MFGLLRPWPGAAGWDPAIERNIIDDDGKQDILHADRRGQVKGVRRGKHDAKHATGFPSAISEFSRSSRLSI